MPRPAPARNSGAEDVRPADGFVAAGVIGDADEAPAEPDPRDAEIERLRAELAAARSAGPVYAPGRKYTVSLHDGPTAVVECGPGEHPFDAYKRCTGVLSSMHGPVVTEAPDHADPGIVR